MSLSAINHAGILLCITLWPVAAVEAQEPDLEPGLKVGEAQTIRPDIETFNRDPDSIDLQLEVIINSVSTGMIGTFRRGVDCGLAAPPQELRDVGINPARGRKLPEGRVCIDRLRDLEYRLDMQKQQLHVVADDAARAAKMIDMDPEPERERRKPQSSTGLVLNYALFSSSNNLLEREVKPFRGVSGGFDARFFSPFGTINQSFTASLSDGELQGVRRLNTSWNYSDPERMVSYRAGDIVTGGFPWTRPIYLGGLQVRRNFSLRSDLVTLPMPVVSGSAAVPSTLDVYTNNVRTYSGDVPAGPFQLANFPVITGTGEAEIVLKDSLGRETRTRLPFYTSSKFLAPGLVDFSVEAGFPRRNFGVESDDYAHDFIGTATTRYGVANWLTLEGHLEGSADLLNGGVGAAFPLASYGALSLAAAGSRYRGESGLLLNAALELTHGSYTLYGRMQRAFGSYEDVASVSADLRSSSDYLSNGFRLFSARVPRSLAQVTVSMPSPFRRSSLNFSFTQVESDWGERNRIIGASYSQSLFKSGSLYATAFKDLDENDSFGVFAGLSMPFGNNISGSTGIEQTSDGISLTADISRSERTEQGSYGWRARTREGAVKNRSLSASYRAKYARIEGEVQQYDDNVQASVWVDGAIAIAGGGIFAANRISDAFAVVDVGAPDIEVLSENKPVGRTDSGGRLLVPDLNSYESNQLAIDPKNLPVDAAVGSTREIVVPADQSGVVVDFHVKQSHAAAIVELIHASGEPLAAGSLGMLDGGGEFIVGYGGEAYIEGLGKHNDASVDLSNGGICHARFAFNAIPESQVTIRKVVCR